MAWNGLGQFVLNPLYSPEINGNIIDAVRYNGLTSDLAAGITASIAKNGENVPIANLPMGGFKHTGAAAATAAGQYVEFDQFFGMAQNSQSAAYTLVLLDKGKHIFHPAADVTARVWTIPANASVAFTVGTCIAFVNDLGAGAITIAITSDTLVLGGTTLTGSRTLSAGGMALAIKVTSTKWFISGTGLA